MNAKLAVAAAFLLAAAAAPTPAGAAARDGRIAFADRPSRQIWSVDPDGGAATQLTHFPKNVMAARPSWSPDGRHLLFSVSRTDRGSADESRTWIMDADGNGAHELAGDTKGFRDYQPHYTPDATSVVFSRCLPDDGVCAIWTMRADGTQKRALTAYRTGRNERVDFDPAVAPVGGRIAFTRFNASGITSQVFVADARGRGAHPITPPSLEAFHPSWSPNGGTLTFASASNHLGSNIFTARADGTGLRRLTATGFPNNSHEPVFSPRGDRIAFGSGPRHGLRCFCFDLYVMRADGSQQRLVRTGRRDIGDIAWGPAP